MKRYIFFLLLLLPFAGFGQYKKKAKLIVPGRWREVVRMLPDSTVTVFRDTLYMSFEAKDSFSYHFRNGFIYEGIYHISEDSLLDLGTDRYRVLERKPSRMVLTNSRGIFHFAVDSTPVIKTIVLEKEDSSLPVTDIDVMIGRWTVYKRATPGPGTIDASENIRSVYITGASTDGKLGYVYSGADADNNPSWYIKEYTSDQSLACAGKNPRTLKVLRCQKGELILEEEQIKYYLKLYK